MWITRWLLHARTRFLTHYRNSVLFRHITWILCLKLLLLLLIWQLIVKPYKMRPDSEMVFNHLIRASQPQPVSAPAHGE